MLAGPASHALCHLIQLYEFALAALGFGNQRVGRDMRDMPAVTAEYPQPFAGGMTLPKRRDRAVVISNRWNNTRTNELARREEFRMLTEKSGVQAADALVACRFDQTAFDDAMKRCKSAQKRKEPEAAMAWLLVAEAISYLPAS